MCREVYSRCLLVRSSRHLPAPDPPSIPCYDNMFRRTATYTYNRCRYRDRQKDTYRHKQINIQTHRLKRAAGIIPTQTEQNGHTIIQHNTDWQTLTNTGKRSFTHIHSRPINHSHWKGNNMTQPIQLYTNKAIHYSRPYTAIIFNPLVLNIMEGKMLPGFFSLRSQGRGRGGAPLPGPSHGLLTDMSAGFQVYAGYWVASTLEV